MPNLTARAGRWSATHRRAAIGGWIVFVALSVLLGGMAGFRTSDGSGGAGSSARGDAAISRAFHDAPQESVIVEHPRLAPAAFRDTVDDVVRRLRAAAHVRSARTVRTSAHATLIEVRLDGEHADGALAATRAASRAHPGFFIGQFGETSLDDAMGEAVGKDLSRAELLSLPVTLAILLVAFG